MMRGRRRRRRRCRRRMSSSRNKRAQWNLILDLPSHHPNDSLPPAQSGKTPSQGTKFVGGAPEAAGRALECRRSVRQL